MSLSRQQADATSPVLILGAGINGAAVARDLALNGIPVCMVDQYDIAYGATSKPSRLIHGGLRYLEYGDFRLVQESLHERTHLIRTAPHFVKPLRLYIPVAHRASGVLESALKFLGAGRSNLGQRLLSMLPGSKSRGYWLVQMGLTLYDLLASDETFPRHAGMAVTAPRIPQVNAAKFRWLCAYSDAQMLYPERFVLALLHDTQSLQDARQYPFELWTHHSVELQDDRAIIYRLDDEGQRVVARELQPALVINATGAWGDTTLEQLHVESRRLFGGTKGSHFFTRQSALREALGTDGIYAEADDGRLVFILPFRDGVFVGTTDEHFEGDPGEAIASEEELEYLVGMVNEVMPEIELQRDDIDWHYCGVRPLPYAGDSKAASIPRGHWIERNDTGAIPVLTLIGGKLTTCRSLAEEVAKIVLEWYDQPRTGKTEERIVPGGENYPGDDDAVAQECRQIADRTGWTASQVTAVWELSGRLCDDILSGADESQRETVLGTDLPLTFVRWVIEHEWVSTLSDLIERRLMLVYDPAFTSQALEQLADCLIQTGHLSAEHRESAMDTATARLLRYYGRSLD